MMEATEEQIGIIYRLARYHARKMFYPDRSVGYDDFVAEGVMGALRALPRWDPEISTLNTFLTFRIRGAMLDVMKEEVGRRHGACCETVRIHPERFEGRQVVVKNFSEICDIEGDYEPLWLNAPTGPPRADVADSLARYRKMVTGKDWLILMYRYGQNMEMWQIGKIIGVSESRISQLCKRLKERFPGLN